MDLACEAVLLRSTQRKRSKPPHPIHPKVAFHCSRLSARRGAPNLVTGALRNAIFGFRELDLEGGKYIDGLGA